MKYAVTALALATAALLTACASNEAQQRQDAQVRDARAAVLAAEKSNTVMCPTAETCQKAWQLARAYAAQHSDMRFQFSDDTTATTYAPFDYERVGIRLAKTPDAGTSSRIEIVAQCKGADTNVPKWVIECSRRLTAIYGGFRPFIESKL